MLLLVFLYSWCISKKWLTMGLEKVSQHLRALTAFPEDLGSTSSTYVADLQSSLNRVSGVPTLFSGICDDCTDTHGSKHSYIYNLK